MCVGRIAPGQFVKQVTEENQAQMIRCSAKQPGVKEQELRDLIQGEARIDSLPKVAKFELSAESDPQMLNVNARILPHPYLSYKNPDCFYVGTDGQWNLGNRPVSFFKGKKLKSWALVSLLDERAIMIPGENGIEAFLNDLSQTLKDLAVSRPDANLSRPPIVYSNQHSLLKSIQTAKERAHESYGQPPDIILCLFPSRSKTVCGIWTADGMGCGGCRYQSV